MIAEVVTGFFVVAVALMAKYDPLKPAWEKKGGESGRGWRKVFHRTWCGLPIEQDELPGNGSCSCSGPERDATTSHQARLNTNEEFCLISAGRCPDCGSPELLRDILCLGVVENRECLHCGSRFYLDVITPYAERVGDASPRLQQSKPEPISVGIYR